MASDYLALLVFLLFSLFFPLSILLFSRLVRKRGRQNEVATLNFESSEESIGNRLTLMREYFHYFSAFLAFEVIAAVLLLWAIVERSMPPVANYAVLAFAIIGFVFEAFAMLIATRGG